MQLLSIRDGAARGLETPPARLEAGELLWIDCHYGQARSGLALAESLCGVQVFEDHVLDAENLAHPSVFEATRHYELLIFRGLALPDPASEDRDITKIRSRPTVFFLLPGCLVTVRAADSRTVAALRARLLEAGGSRQRLPDSPESLMLRLLNSMVDRYMELRQPLAAQLGRWQQRLLDPRRPFRDWYALLEARDELRKLEQLCEEQLDALQEWRDERLELASEKPPASGTDHAPLLGPLPEALQVRANDVANHIQRVLGHARRMQDSIESAVQLHFSSTAHRTNEIMRTLTTITAIFMPLTLITGIFGMNFEFIPGLHARAGFWIAMGAMVLVAIALLVWFRARRYLSPSTLAPRTRPARTRPAAQPTGEPGPEDGDTARR